MKKIIMAIAILFALGSMRVSAQEQKRVQFYYYPSSNVYYNVETGHYWYYDEPTVKWVEVQSLPSTIVLEKSPSYTVYHNGEEIWRDNAIHQEKYKSKKEAKKEGKKEGKKEAKKEFKEEIKGKD